MQVFKLKSANLSPALCFAVFASFFGLLILIITPPFQTPDEINHFFRVYQISEGNLTAVKQDNRVGGFIPKSIVEITQPFKGLIGNRKTKTTFRNTLDQFKTPLNSEDRQFVDFPNTGMYSPVSYIPQVFPVFVLRKINVPPLYIFFGARLFSLLFWITAIYWVIRILPFYKWTFTLVALLPMSLYINMSISADVVSNILSFMLIAYFLKLAYDETLISFQNLVVITLLAILLAMAKVVYTPVVLLFLLIPIDKFKSKRTHYYVVLFLFSISFLTMLYWSEKMNGLYLPYSRYNPQFRDNLPLGACTNMYEQTQYILHHGFYIWHVLANSMIATFDMYFQGYIGTFGWLESKLPIWLIYSSYIILFIIVLSDGNKAIKIKWKHKIVVLTAFLISLILLLLSQHLTWDCVGSDIISTIQGKYLIPIFPLLLILVYNHKFIKIKIVLPIVLIFSFISLSISLRTIYERFYIMPKSESVTIKCGAETVTKEYAFETNIPSIFLENGIAQSNEKAHTGLYSLKLTPDYSCGFTYRFFNCKMGDKINVTVWRYGKVGSIVITGDSNKDFYVAESKVIAKDSMGWEQLQLNFKVPKNMEQKETGIFLYDMGTDTVYFDDLVIHYISKN